MPAASAFLHPFAPPSKPEADYIRIVRGDGALLWDADGNEYVDGMASLWYCQVGHGRTEIIDAITMQLRAIEAYNTFDPFTNEPAAELAEMVAARSPHPDGRVFLACSGSEAVDTALKLARMYAQLRGDADRQIIVGREKGYHGTNIGGTSAQGLPPNREGWGDLLPHIVHVPHDDLEGAAAVFAAQGDRIAAAITEPIQGAGGVWPPPEGYLPGLRRLCDQHGALLILDEVICGFGRTGEWFGAQHYGVVPDLITFAKGVSSGYQPLAGVIVSRQVAEALASTGEMLRTGYTYSGHPTACAAGIANMEVLEGDGLVDRAKTVGTWLRDGLAALAVEGLIEGYRGDGAVYAAELGRDATGLRAALLEHGAILRPIGSAVCFCPPLVISEPEVARLFDGLEAVLRT
jgi:adenosylmethionine-8-amino-7-oxononanoate aminotransferase